MNMRGWGETSAGGVSTLWIVITNAGQKAQKCRQARQSSNGDPLGAPEEQLRSEQLTQPVQQQTPGPLYRLMVEVVNSGRPWQLML